ncbi:hypothetical protein TNIN_181491, partial [Trichonephila inaurata madagascariensis]
MERITARDPPIPIEPQTGLNATQSFAQYLSDQILYDFESNIG